MILLGIGSPRSEVGVRPSPRRFSRRPRRDAEGLSRFARFLPQRPSGDGREAAAPRAKPPSRARSDSSCARARLKDSYSLVNALLLDVFSKLTRCFFDVVPMLIHCFLKVDLTLIP